MLNTVFGFFVVITIIIFIHEYGHYLAARLFGVRVEEFSIGFGKEIISARDSAGTKWKISAIPLGGYVRMFGDADIASTKGEGGRAMSKRDRAQSFTHQPPLKRMIIALAGPLSNYILAFVIFASVFFAYGKLTIDNSVSGTIENSPAQVAGIMPGDRIVSIDGIATRDFTDIYSYVSLRPNTNMSIEVERDHKIVNIKLTSGARDVQDLNGKTLSQQGVLGVKASKPEYIQMGIYSACKESVSEVVLVTRMIKDGLVQLIMGKRSIRELRGTIYIAQESGSSLQNGYVSLAIYIALLSINIGFLNLLPIPMLDGGHILSCALEIIFGKILFSNIKAAYISKIFNIIGILIIIFMFVISISNDINAILF